MLEQYQETPEDYGYVREESLPNFENLRDHIKGIVEAVYEDGDISKLEFCLDEVCHEIGIPIKEEVPLIEKKGSNNIINSYLDFQKAEITRMGRIS